ncbi:MAG: hypothetical protein G01um101419_441 [Parcubacteria group bacterium Gr01-1014_19]|nr:MAG: hypothetical protein G01um101419_441 [Parcubacteria group bacterium Gr01-1014_19]
MIYDLLKGLAIGAGAAATIVVAALAVMAIVWRRRLNVAQPAVPTVGGQAVAAGAPAPVHPPVHAPMKNRGWRLVNMACQCLLFALIFLVPAALIWPGGTFLSRVSPMIRAILAAGWFFPCWTKVSSYRGVVIAFLGKTWRSRPEGPTWIFRPFFISIETAVREAVIDRSSIPFAVTAETKKRDGAPLKGFLQYSKKTGELRNYFMMDDAAKKTALTDWIKYFIQLEAHQFDKREQVFADIKGIGKRVTFALKHAHVGHARDYQKESVKNGGQLVSFEKAAEMVQTNDGIVTKQVKHWDIGKNAKEILKDIFS